MKKIVRELGVSLLILFAVQSAFAAELVSYSTGSAISGSGNYEWWYGCAPTSAAMLLSQYDRNGYSNLIPGGEAEASTFGNSLSNVNSAIASSGHIRDFYSGLSCDEGYQISGDDTKETVHSFDCLADFMGTSQDAYENENGSTTEWFFSNNSSLSFSKIYSLGSKYYDSSGMYGIYEYILSRGYQVTELYNQCIYGYKGISAGFTYEQYKAEIDAGRGVLIQVKGHTMYGYGYVNGTDTIKVYDTWGPGGQNPGTMTWGGSYGSMAHYGVTVLELAAIPEPSAIAILGIGCLIFFRKK
jgi:hypothetical protein